MTGTRTTRRTTLALVPFALVAIVTLWACRGDGNKQGATTPDTLTVRVACLFPMTGPGASLGEYLRNGTALAEEDLEAAHPGTLQIELDVLDTKNQPKEAVSALRSALARRRPDAVISGLSSISSAVVPIVEEEGILTVATTTALTDLPVGKRHVVRVYPTSEDFVEPVARYGAKQYKAIAVLYIHDDFGDSNRKAFSRLVESEGGTITAAEPYELQQTEARSLIERVLATSPKAVFVTGYGPAFISIFRQLREVRPDLPVLTEIGFANPAVLGALGNDADGVIFDGTDLELSVSENPDVESFRRRYRERFGAEPYQVAGFAYESLTMIVEATLGAGGKGAPTKADVIALSPHEGVMGSIHLDAEGESRIGLRLMRREGGQTLGI